jgi:hypothetical protein
MQENGTIKFLVDILKFYAEKDNYLNNKILTDSGHLAKFGLEQIKYLEDQNTQVVNQFNEHENNSEVNESIAEINNLLNDLNLK